MAAYVQEVRLLSGGRNFGLDRPKVSIGSIRGIQLNRTNRPLSHDPSPEADGLQTANFGRLNRICGVEPHKADALNGWNESVSSLGKLRHARILLYQRAPIKTHGVRSRRRI